MTRARFQTARIRRNRALGAMEAALNYIQAEDPGMAALALERAAGILREPVKDPAVCRDPNAGMCGACDCWKVARAYAS